MSRYYIPDYVHFAVEGDTAVFMDLRSDQYSMLLGAKAHTFASLISHSGSTANHTIALVIPAGQETLSDIQALISDLLDNNLITASKGEAELPLSRHISLPTENLLDFPASKAPTIRPRDAYRFFVSCLLSAWRLRRVSIERIVRTVARRKKSEAPGFTMDLDEVRRLVRLYNALRPMFPRDFLCMFDSLALLEFLAKYSFFPNWVFAVQLEPWAAHCWVQYGTVAFNQDTFEAHAYLPIMRV